MIRLSVQARSRPPGWLPVIEVLRAVSLTDQVEEKLKPEEQKEIHKHAHEIINATVKACVVRKDQEKSRINAPE